MPKKYELENNPLFSPEQIKEINQEQGKPKTGRPRVEGVNRERGAKNGLHDGWTRLTVILKEETIERARNYCYTERLSFKEGLSELLEGALDAYEKNGGTILDRNARKRVNNSD